MPRNPTVAALLLAAALVAAPPGRTAEPGCAGAKTPSGQAICREPQLAAADSEMQGAYSLLRAQLPPARQAALAIDQQAWERAREASCGDKREGPLRHCLLDETEARRHMLSGEGRNGAAAGPALEPAFFREVRKGAYEIEIAYPQLHGNDAASGAFNGAARAFILGDEKLMAQFRSATGASLVSVSYDLIYLDRAFATVVYWIVSMNPGWAHPFIARESLAFDLSLGRQLAPADVILAPGRAVGAIAAMCRKRLEEEAQQGGWALAARADPVSIVDDFHNWAPGAFALDLLFDPGSLVAYAAGPRACRLDYASIAQWLRRDGPLPPK